MAKVTHVKAAQQRYETKPVLDEHGDQKVVAVTKADGSPKTTKRGIAITRRLTVNDLDRPLPPHNCGSCKEPIVVGTSYKWIAPKSGPYGGTKLFRHESCPDWNVWEYSSSLSARLAEISHNGWGAFEEAENHDDVVSALDSVADEVRSLAEEKRESASNIEEGFGHATSSSEELEETAQTLDDWADEIGNIDVPDDPEPEEGECEACEGSGEQPNEAAIVRERVGGFDREVIDESVSATVPCKDCDGSGRVTPEEPTEEQRDEWKEEANDVFSVIDNSPV